MVIIYVAKNIKSCLTVKSVIQRKENCNFFLLLFSDFFILYNVIAIMLMLCNVNAIA